MSHIVFLQVIGLLGLRIRYWIIIIAIVIVILALLFYARGRRA